MWPFFFACVHDRACRSKDAANQEPDNSPARHENAGGVVKMTAFRKDFEEERVAARADCSAVPPGLPILVDA